MKLSEAAARLQESLDAFDAEVADHLENETERADLWHDMDANAEDIRTVLSALSLGHPIQGEAGEGWVLVPREPTEAMLEASVSPRTTYLTDAHIAVLKDGFAAKYRAMIAASPQPPTPAGVREITDEDYAANVASRLFPQRWGEGTGLTRSTLTAEVRATLAAAKGAGE